MYGGDLVQTLEVYGLNGWGRIRDGIHWLCWGVRSHDEMA